MFFDVVVAAANGAAPNPLEVGHAVRSPRWTVGRQLRLSLEPGLGLWEFRSVFRIKGLPSGGSRRQHQDEKHGRQRRDGGEKAMAHLRSLSAVRITESWVCPIPARAGRPRTHIPTAQRVFPDA